MQRQRTSPKRVKRGVRSLKKRGTSRGHRKRTLPGYRDQEEGNTALNRTARDPRWKEEELQFMPPSNREGGRGESSKKGEKKGGHRVSIPEKEKQFQ